MESIPLSITADLEKAFTSTLVNISLWSIDSSNDLSFGLSTVLLKDKE